MPDMTSLYSVFSIFFESAAARFEYRIHLHIAACSPRRFEMLFTELLFTELLY